MLDQYDLVKFFCGNKQSKRKRRNSKKTRDIDRELADIFEHAFVIVFVFHNGIIEIDVVKPKLIYYIYAYDKGKDKKDTVKLAVGIIVRKTDV